MKSKILTLAAIIAFGFAANAHIVVMGGAVSVTSHPDGATTINCGNDPQAVCAIIGGSNEHDVVIETGGIRVTGSSYEIGENEIRVLP